MKLLDILPVTLLLWFTNQPVYSKITCSKNQYTVVKNGTEYCLGCEHCPDGHGLSPPCGSKVDHPPQVKCVQCEAGKTYSDGHDPSSCKNCHICSGSEIVIKNCTIYFDTICSNTCEEGYYHENSTYDCQKCSYCCNNGNDIRMKECQSMPSNKQCSVHSTQQCKPEPATTSQVVTTYPSSTTTGSTTSSASVSSKPNAVIIIIPVIGVILAVIIIIVLYKRRKKTRNSNINVSNNQRGEVEDGRLSLLQNHGSCDLKHMPLNVTRKSPNQITEGQKILLSLSYMYDNQNDNRKCSFDFEWKKDGDSIPNNNCQNYSKDLNIDNVEVADSGRYYCKVHCSEHDHKEDSSTIEIRVHPGEGNELKLFSELDHSVQQRVINLLTPETKGIGNWMDLGREYGMEEDDLKALVDNKAAAVIGYMKSRFPELTVFDFCKVLKSAKMKQMKIVKILKKELTKPKETAAKSESQTVNRPDSGISDGFDSDGPLQVNLPPEASSKPINSRNLALPNLSYADSREASRESSIEDLSGSFYDHVKSTKPVDDKGYSKGVNFFRRKKSGDSQVNNDSNGEEDEEPKSDTRKKTKYGRQMSKDSQKSDIDDVGNRERKRSRSSSITSSLKSFVLKQPSVEYSPLDHHHEESDDGGLQA